MWTYGLRYGPIKRSLRQVSTQNNLMHMYACTTNQITYVKVHKKSQIPKKLGYNI